MYQISLIYYVLDKKRLTNNIKNGLYVKTTELYCHQMGVNTKRV